MKVLHINTVDNEGGAAKVALVLHQLLALNGHTSHFLVKIKKSHDNSILVHQPNDLLAHISNVLKLITSKTAYPILQDLFFKVFANDVTFLKPTSVLSLKAYQNADLIHCHNLHGRFIDLNILPIMSNDKPVVWTLHDMWAFTGHCGYSQDCVKWKYDCRTCPYLSMYQGLPWDNSHNLLQLKRNIYVKSNLHIVVPSRWLYTLVEESILRDKKIYYIPNGVNTKLFTPGDKTAIRKELHLPSYKNIIIFSAYRVRQNHWKGWNIVEEFSRTAAATNTLVVCIGAHPSDSKYNSDLFRFIPTISNPELMAKYFACSDLLLFPSRYDNFSLTILESMSCGTPVVAFDIGGNAEIIRNDINGFLVPYMDIGSFIKTIHIFLKSNKHKKLMISQEARKTVIDNFDERRMFSTYKDLYSSLIRD